MVSDALIAEAVPHRVSAAGSLFSVFFTDTHVVDYETAKTQNSQAFSAFFHAMLERGVYLPPSAYEAWFVSAAHDDSVLDQVGEALPYAAKAAAAVVGTDR